MSRELSLKQKKAMAILVGNGGNVTDAMLKAGYSPNTANTPQKLTESPTFRAEYGPVVEKINRERDRALALMAKKVGKAKYRDLVDGVDKMTKNAQLLSGGDTERHGGYEKMALEIRKLFD